ncbi:WD repeat-containing protein 93 isoform X1 [Cyprinus carpio]|uniref:WD repeat-containing protein 93 isoform X1 n=1 Tax=Cyprinus carpio TaxID=7962 RepID=A0A9R0AZ55_CYPCA|nr:WD repeat-containing protein 93 isoform X1 [Cyprinus carpio]
MAVNVRRGLEIPEPSDYSSCEDDDVTYFTDLQRPDNNLPESARVISKLLNNLVDSAWEVISEQEKIKRDEEPARQIPVLNATKEMKLPGRTNSIVSSDDGLYLFLGHTHGLSVISSSTLTCVRTWQDERVEITSISCASLGNATHLLFTVDDMGIARLFVHHMENIHLIKVINETEDINQRNICAKFEVSRSGDFGAAVMTCKFPIKIWKCNIKPKIQLTVSATDSLMLLWCIVNEASGSVWLDVYRFPLDVWLKELETKQATQTQQTTEAKLSPVILLMKIKPPEIPAGTSLKSPSEVLQKTEEGTIIGSGQNHLISSRQWENQDAAFKKMFMKYLSSSSVMTPQQKAEGPSNCTLHFLVREGFHSMSGEANAARDIPIAVCLWWNGSHNLLEYLLLKTLKEKDSEPRPDVLWPNSQEILCSAVSACTRFIVLGLDGQLVTIWDRRFGFPYANIVIPGDGAICRMKLLLQSQLPGNPLFQGPFLPTLQLVLTCRNGACYSVTAGGGGDTCTVALIERPAGTGSSVTVAEPMPFLKCLIFLMQRNGQVSIWETEDGAPVFILNLPPTHVLGSLREPVCLLEPVQQKLYISGDRKRPLMEVTDRNKDETSLFIFSFSECTLMDLYRVASPAVSEKETRATLSDLEEACNLYFKERADSWKERKRNLAFQWEQLSKRDIK